mmetsp:Transcript_8512/g.21712  ORF Transcript_8512/g.21712 Transcript_8512/m.21712 type:complete len:119 (-) Transcript_8512:539-895(-)
MSRAASIWHSIWRVSRFCRSLKVTISVPCLHGYLCYYREASRELLAYGYSYIGKDLLYSGTSGDLLRAFVFMGPVFYQKLKHMVMDKMHSRARGSILSYILYIVLVDIQFLILALMFI